MKEAIILLHGALTKIGWAVGREYSFVANVHDEFQAEVTPKHTKMYGELAVNSIKKAGIALKMRCPLDGEYKVGKNWAETH
jgi:DNA polymerase I-like protein with 3'-5' exonuclease and polymerase domains